MAAVACHALSKTYGSGAVSVHALRSVDLEVHAGEIFMLVGPSGCGKTTLISILAGILDPSSGSCEVLGYDFAQMKPRDKVPFRAKNIGFVFQSYNLLPALTAAENVSVPLLINRVPRAQALRRAEEMLQRVGLGNRSNALPAQLSGGQQQRVAIARALVHEPALIVCDEPTSALDHETGRSVMELLHALAVSRGCTLLIVTHDSRIYEYAHRIAHMDDGKIISLEEVVHE